MDTKTYAAFLETLPCGAAVVDSSNRVVMMNQHARALLGAPDVIEGLQLELGDSGAQVRTLRRFDGGIESLAVRTSRMTLEGVELVLAMLNPLDDEERVRQALRLVGNMGVFDHDHLTDVLYVSPEHREIFGLAPDAPVTLPGIVEQVHPDDRERVIAAVTRAHDPAGDGTFDIEYRVVRADGTLRWVSVRSVTTFDGTGAARRPIRTVGAELDVTNRRRDESALRAWAHAIASSSTGLAVAELSGHITYANRALLDLWGLASEVQLLGSNLLEHRADPAARKVALDSLAANGRWSGELECLRTDSGRVPTLASLSTVTDPGGRPVSVIASFVDISDRVRAEAERRRLANVLDATPDIVSVARMNRDFLYVNKAGRRLRGIGETESLAGHKLGETLSPAELANIEEGIEYASKHGTWCGETKIMSANGEQKELSVVAQVHGSGLERTVSVISRDITAQRKLEAQLRQSQKMEAVGSLASGVAHDFNNLLTVINTTCELLLGEGNLPPSTRDDLEVILQTGLSAASLTHQLLAFSRRQVLQPISLDLNELVDHVDKLLRRVLGEDVELQTHRGADLWPVRVDRGQVEQVLVNLAVNARDAMPHGGKLTLETSNVLIDEAYVRRHADAMLGEHVMLAVSDTGQGMTPEVLQHIFEPFFSTKGERGTGLGLATVYGIVRQSGGHIQVYSEPGRGTSFKVYLPRDPRAPVVAQGPTPAPRRATSPATIVVVEDSEGVRELVRRFLELRGHRVFTCAGPREAIALLQQLESVDLLVTDVVMPEMSGRELADQLQQSRPSLRVLFMSGYAANAIVEHGVLEAGLDFIAKPFAVDAFGMKVDEVLSR